MKDKGDNVVLIGFMGSGKTTVGIKLSYALRRTVEDTDKLIERQENRSISEIFAQEGESYFRILETTLLENLRGSVSGRILSVGGGTPVRQENRPLLQALGTVVYLRVQPETVYQRLKDDRTRPLLQGENPRGRIQELLASRKDAYESCADLIVDVDGRDAGDIAEEIAAYIRR